MLERPVQYVKGVGPARAEVLAKAGIRTLEDLLRYKPFRYEDRTHYRPIAQLKEDEEVLIEAEVAVAGRHTSPAKRVQIFELVALDSSGSLPVVFFNQPYLEKVLRKGRRVVFFGVPRRDSYTQQLSLVNPEFEIVESDSDRAIHTGRVVPVYRRVGRITSRHFRQILFQLLADLPSTVPDPIPAELLRRYRFPERRKAFGDLHFPQVPEDAEERARVLELLEQARSPAHQRFIYEEFFLFQFGLQLVRQQREEMPKQHRIEIKSSIREIIKSVLPFRPTAAQKRVLKEIVDDLRSPHVMNRLLQGDVGSGKTIVALQAMIVAIENGFQAALMAPTEILAEQHYEKISRYLAPTSYQVGLITGSVKGKRRKEVLGRIASGEVNLAIGTHAVIQDKVDFRRLALVVIDEQHRFGVVQRSKLIGKGDRPDTLVMTATPIPRSLALTVYGDLDLSVMDELPPGRLPIRTIIREERHRGEVYRILREAVEKGRQVFVVYPLVEESEKMDLRAATEMADHLQQAFPDLTLGLIHGRLKAEEKEGLMGGFREGEIQILVATSVIEVGIDVPNATVMVIEHADRFGLSQLHQLRGRIGRGEHASLCILMVESLRGGEAAQRLEIMRETNDGFKIAEKDLEIRGPGELVGTRQWGVPQFTFGNIVRDRRLLELARQDAQDYLEQCRQAGSPQSEAILSQVREIWNERFGLYYVG